MIYLSTQTQNDYVVEQALEYCPFCGSSIAVENTHQLEHVLSQPLEFLIRFSDGENHFTNCSQIDYSIYQEVGGWSCESKQGLVDIYEKDIHQVLNATTGEVLYEK